MAEVDPMVGNWYENLESGQRFEVIAVDEEEGTVEIQFFDGTVEEIDIDIWYEMDLDTIEAPEDWSGPMEQLEEDDLGYNEAEMGPEEWQETNKRRNRQQESWENVESEEEEGREEPEETHPEEESWEEE